MISLLRNTEFYWSCSILEKKRDFDVENLNFKKRKQNEIESASQLLPTYYN